MLIVFELTIFLLSGQNVTWCTCGFVLQSDWYRCQKSTTFLMNVTRLSPPLFLRRERGNEATMVECFI